MRTSISPILFSVLAIIPLFLILSQCQHANKANHAEIPEDAGIDDARIILQHFVHGSIPQYSAKPAGFVRPSSETLSQPEYCFVHHQDDDADLYEYLESNTKAFLVPFAEGIRRLELTEHTTVNEDQMVEKWVYGNQWAVIANFGDEDYLHQNTLLPPYGFIAVGPHFLAQHYYPHADEKTTTLFVHHEGIKNVIY